MIKNKSLKVKNPLIDKLNIERSILSGEVKELNNDLLFIKQLIRNKQSDLTELNALLVNKTLRGPFLSVVSSNQIQVNKFDIEDKGRENSALVCIDGGKN